MYFLGLASLNLAEMFHQYQYLWQINNNCSHVNFFLVHSHGGQRMQIIHMDVHVKLMIYPIKQIYSTLGIHLKGKSIVSGELFL